MLQFTSFDSGENASFSTDPDTFDNPSFGATVGQLNGTLAEAAYVSTGRRCTGTMHFDSTQNALIATLAQISPIP